MDHVFYKQQIERLKNQWPQAYSEERMVIFYNAFRDVSNFDFRDAVTECLSTNRSAPLLPELTLAIEKARINYFQQKRIEEEKLSRGMFGLENNGAADPDFAKKCVELFKQFDERKITREQFDQGCDLLEQASKLFPIKKQSSPLTDKPITKPYKDDEDEKPF